MSPAANDHPVLDLRGRRAVVTGASRGIGAATVKLLAAAGADVVVGYRARKTDADAVVEAARAVGVRAVACAADVATGAGAEALVKTGVDELGGVDLFVGNAGIWPPENVPISDMDDAQWHRTVRENLDSIFFTTRAITRAISDGGRIVLVS
ncbi:MAG: SDR family NAD(P)-dependent oxidoreductase, partial [Gemmatimonadaceae bacterium]